MSELLWGVVGFLLTIMVLSYLLGDNIFFRIATHIFLGVASAYFVVLIINHVLIPQLVTPLLTGTWPELAWTIIPSVLILLLVISQVPRLKSIGMIPLAFLLGATAALVIGGAVFGTILPQSRAVIDAFEPGDWGGNSREGWMRILEASVMLVGTVSTLSFFHFGRKRKQKNDGDASQSPKVIHLLGKIGEVFIGITLGAFFAGLFSTTLVALIDRIVVIGQFILQFFGGS